MTRFPPPSWSEPDERTELKGRRSAARTRVLQAAVVLAGGMVLASCADQDPTATPSLQASVQQGASADVVPGQIIVRFRANAQADQVARANGAAVQRAMRGERTFVLRVEPGTEHAAVARLARNPNIEFAEPDYLLSVIPCELGMCEPTNDLFFGRKWDLHNDGFIRQNTWNSPIIGNTGKADADIDWLEAYNFIEQNGGVTGSAVIAILDTGIRGTHQDLAGKVIGGINYAGGAQGNWSDTNGHGTHVAGIAAAYANNNGLGVMGVGYSPNIKLLSVRVCNDSGCPTSAIADGIRWAADNGAHIINMSLGGAFAQAAIQSALQYADSRNVLSFCASGNDNRRGISFPAGFPECVAVGSTNWSDNRASYSNYGPGMELAAPGGDDGGIALIASTYHTADNAYVYMAGTSMASPQAAGLAGLVRAYLGITDRAQLRTHLRNTADDLGTPGWDELFGYGRINAYQAIRPLVVHVDMDLQPGTISLSNTSVVNVVLLSRPGFNATAVSANGTRIVIDGAGSVAPAMRAGNAITSTVDWNGDGLPDRIISFRTSDLVAAGLTISTSDIQLTGQHSAQPFVARDGSPPTLVP